MGTSVKSLLGRGAPWWRLLRVPLFCLVACGCLSKARTPYNEVGLFSDRTPRSETDDTPMESPELAAPPNKTVNLWPLYNGDGRAHYIAWPFIKWSPGCFAIQPFYNHDHGIHDFLWICTLSPKSGEYRLWPLFYRSPKWWMLLPLAYGTDTAYGSPLLFNHNDNFTHVLNVVTWKDGGDVQRQNRLLFPLWFSRTYEGSDAKAWFTPLAGAGEDPRRNAKWWFALTAGKSATRSTTLRWALPFWISYEKGDCFVHWTPLSFGRTEKDSSELDLGPLGLPLPFYCYDSLGREDLVCFPFWYSRNDWYASSARDGSSQRIAPKRKSRAYMMGLLGSSTRHYRPNALPVDTLKKAFRLESGWEWQVGWNLLAASDIETLTLLEWKGSLTRERTQSHRFGWLLWSHSRTTDAQGLASSSFSTPLYSQERTRDSVSHGLLLNTLSWRNEAEGLCHFQLLWGLGALYYSDILETGCQSHFELLLELLFSASTRRTEGTTTFDNCAEKRDWQRQTSERSLLCGLLYRHKADLETAKGPMRKWCDDGSDRANLASDQASKDHDAMTETSLLSGLLYSHTSNNRQEWTYPRGGVCPEKPTLDRCTEKTSALTPLVYRSEAFRDGSSGRRLLFGLLYDHTRNVREKTESFGLLGYLYRSNLYADGTRERTMFPFITASSNAAKGTSAFGFLHKLFRVESGPEGKTVWLFWMRL